MVDMRMGQQHGRDAGGFESEGAVEPCRPGAYALEHAAVEQESFSIIEGDQVFGARDCAGSAMKGYLHRRDSIG